MQSTQAKQDRIRELLRERNAILLAHNYQRAEVQAVADRAGDSLGLSQEAAQTSADVIVFAGVHFMAETAHILAPQKTVILPALQAGCPMADMISAEKLIELKQQYPDHQVLCYVNSSAEVKAHSDMCCTSGNVLSVVRAMKADKILMVPDKNLAKFAAAQIPEKQIDWFDGYCPTHNRVSAEDIRKARAEHPDAQVVVHPECDPEVTALADHVCSTSGMYGYVRETDAREFIIGTEMGVIFRMREENPDKQFHLASRKLLCPNMKMTTLDDIIESLEQMKNQITVPPAIREQALSCLQKMISLPRNE